MKRNYLTLITGIILILIFGSILFLFQVRQTEVAAVTTFGRFTHSITNAGPHLRWPWPIQKIYKFDTRVKNFEKKFEQTSTQDGRILLLTVFVGWHIADPEQFLISFSGDPIKAERTLEPLIRNTKNGVIGAHPYGDLISTNRNELKFDEIEEEMLTSIRPQALNNYGIEIDLLGIKRLGIPEGNTQTVFQRMVAERQRLIKQFRSEGQAEATNIVTEAELERKQILAEARAKKEIIEGEAEAEAAKAYSVFQQNPDLAIFLFQLRSIEQSLKNRATLILDEQTPPFNLLNQRSVDEIASEPESDQPALSRSQ
jgi:membrane protease subunit HflC